MTDEVQNLAEVQSAPAPEATAAPEIAQNEPEVAEDKQPEQQPDACRDADRWLFRPPVEVCDAICAVFLCVQQVKA